jgi:hypothetical protein
MSTLDIITVVAIILFARLGVRLLIRYRKLKKEDKENSSNELN